MAEPVTVDLKKVKILFRDGTTPTPNELELRMGEGNLSYTIKREIEYRRERGNLDHTREGDQQPVELSIEGAWEAMRSSSGDNVRPEEFLQKKDAASAYVSTGGQCEPYAVDVIVQIDQDCGTHIEDEQITFSDFRWEEIGGDFQAGTLSISGMCNITTPTAIRTTFT